MEAWYLVGQPKKIYKAVFTAQIALGIIYLALSSIQCFNF